ncbi:metal-dependent hydrolase [Piscinibacter terrae]|uniref:Metal-dependent hydrolase n=1 Tax=Piscinibacter terrae TaxID=2496871 RepID=A0A3N7JS45_9BURK|nr:metal-dependent hydrolase [Albitalea terrae]RQP23809.1 metal-dependent hydrolase [Albitalea terrae]
MTSLVVRRLLIDLEAPFERRWNGGDAFRSAYFNALSMSFPVGEQFFIDSVRTGMKALPESRMMEFEADVRGFVGQEATHRRIHDLFNGHLANQGYTNTWEKRVLARLERLKLMKDPRHAVAITAATEHLTAIFAQHLLEHPQTVQGAPERLQTLWLWHASEESEHRSIAFDVYRALGGSHEWRVRWMRLVTFHFTTDVLRQTARDLWHDGQLLRWSTWRSAASFFFGQHGLVRHTFKPWRAYFRRDFHPCQQDGSLAAEWLRRHEQAYTVVGAKG